MQVIGVEVPSFFISMLPYISKVLVLVFSTGSIGRRRSISPGKLGTPYDREER